jgi:DNA-binding NarL/FixJ family response regulator
VTAQLVAGIPSSVIRVGVVDDHPVARFGIEWIFCDAAGISVVASAGSVDQLHPAAASGAGLSGLDVVLLDLYLVADRPAIGEVSRLARDVPVLVMSASRRPRDVLAAIEAGAAGYLTKDSAAAAFVDAVKTVRAEGFALSAELADMVEIEMAERRRRLPLSVREREALTLIARGFTHGQVARRMGVSTATVNTYVQRIRAKLQVGNKADLTRAALEMLDEPAGNG